MTGAFGEPLLLGFSSGLACLAACGPVLLPWLAAEGAGWGGTGARMAQFLGGRLVGYLGFATVAWMLGLALPPSRGAGAVLIGVVDLALAALLAAYAIWPARLRMAACPPGLAAARGSSRPARLRAGTHRRWVGPAGLGLLTGLNLCPPFVAAGVRAAESSSLAGALGFFVLFFLGTLVWFLPFLGLGAARRFTGIQSVARVTAGLVAAFYGYRGVVTLTGVLLHVWHARS
jgi:sulfite exporter TauE/SafE